MRKTKIQEFEQVQNLEINYKNKYHDEFYVDFIANFSKNAKKRWLYRFVKRSFDIILSLLMVIVLSPLFLVIALAVRFDSKGPVIFRQKRMGKGYKEFYCYKFRSMRIDAPTDCPTSQLDNPDLYYTRVGKFLRGTSLDELPQLWCVLTGKMSFIGYRPLVLTETQCNDMRKKLGVFEMRPGISGYAQVHGRDDVYYKNKALMDAYYVKHASIWFDIKIMFQTVGYVLFKKGIKNSTKSANIKTDEETKKETKIDNGEK